MYNDFISMLDRYPQLKEDLFVRGFLVTNRCIDNVNKFPFYGNWQRSEHFGYYFYKHKKANWHFYNLNNECIYFILGHAYNPFTMQHDEIQILKSVASCTSESAFYDSVNELTGVFLLGYIKNGRINFLCDPAGMQTNFYRCYNHSFYLSSHAQLIGDICSLEMSNFCKELVNYKWYKRIVGPYLPGDLSPFDDVYRVVPGISYKYKTEISHKRYWPLKTNDVVRGDDYNKVIDKAAEILKNNMILISRKWENPWISLTGGIDSNTTFAAANGIYDKYNTFTYVSAEKETIDAHASKNISSAFNVAHHEFTIPDKNDDIELFEPRKELFMHNNGYIAPLYDNELRKKLYLHDNVNCSVEVKSWVSETIRGYWYKYYGRKKFPKLSPKLFRNLYKIFTTDRKLAHKIDDIFSDFIRKYEVDKIPTSYPPADIHYNDVTWGGWGGLNITEMKYCFDITFIYNNRKFLDLMFKVPLEDRILDKHHLDMKKLLNEKLYDMNIRVKNMKETKFRAFALNVLFTINSILP